MGVNKNISEVGEDSALKHDTIKAKKWTPKVKYASTKYFFLSLMKTHEPLSINHQDVHWRPCLWNAGYTVWRCGEMFAMPGLTLDCDGVTTRSSCDQWLVTTRTSVTSTCGVTGAGVVHSALCTGHKKVYVATLPLPPNSHVWRGRSGSVDNRHGELGLQLNDERSFLDAKASLKQPLLI